MSFLYPNEEYGQKIGKIEKKLGDQRYLVIFSDGTTEVSKLRGALRKVRIEMGDFVLVESVLNLHQIVHKYKDGDIQTIKKEGLYKVEEVKEESEDDDFDFDKI